MVQTVVTFTEQMQLSHPNGSTTGHHQLQTALLVPDNNLLHFAQRKNSFYLENETFFNENNSFHLTICLHLMEPNWAPLGKFLKRLIRLTLGLTSGSLARLFGKILWKTLKLFQIRVMGSACLKRSDKGSTQNVKASFKLTTIQLF